jgi:hypothetical protein
MLPLTPIQEYGALYAMLLGDTCNRQLSAVTAYRVLRTQYVL